MDSKPVFALNLNRLRIIKSKNCKARRDPQRFTNPTPCNAGIKTLVLLCPIQRCCFWPRPKMFMERTFAHTPFNLTLLYTHLFCHCWTTCSVLVQKLGQARPGNWRSHMGDGTSEAEDARQELKSAIPVASTALQGTWINASLSILPLL